MTPKAIDRAARLLLAAREGHYKIIGLPADCRPPDVAAAYAIQARLLELMGARSTGWFIACTNPGMQQIHGLSAPYYGRMLAVAIHESPTIIAVGNGAPTLEIELVFRLSSDLPPQPVAYTEVEVAAAVASVHPGLEVVEGRYEDITAVDGPSLIADNGTDGDLVIGPGKRDWRVFDPSHISPRLIVNGVLAAEGTGGASVSALTWLANELARHGDGLRAGETVNTGNCLSDYVYGRAGDHVIADCRPLGEARVTLV